MLTLSLSTNKRFKWIVAVAFTLATVGSMGSSVWADGPKKKRPSIYDTKADGEKQIADALVKAKRDNKRVLLQFGADWCVWCHRLHHVFQDNKEVARKLLYEYELVLIDVDEVDGKPHNATVNKRFGNPRKHGLPVLVVLDDHGRQLTTKETASLEQGDGHDPAKVLAFLTKWQAKPLSAEETLSTALGRAKAESKNVFVYFSAPWCMYCKKMTNYLADEKVSAALGSAFVPVKIDVDRMTGGEKVAERFSKSKDTGIPYFVILDASGNKLADSIGEKGNVGYPVEPFEIEHFIKVIRQTGRKLSDANIASLEKGLK